MSNTGYSFFHSMAGEDKPLPTSIRVLADSSSANFPMVLQRFSCACRGLSIPFDQNPKLSILLPVVIDISGEREVYKLMTSRSLRRSPHKKALIGFNNFTRVHKIQTIKLIFVFVCDDICY